ncbi:MAG: hypothetical protein HFJ99_05780 [Eubacterium sp.]|nr:hypothetical protein [Eubacterium sp.]
MKNRLSKIFSKTNVKSGAKVITFMLVFVILLQVLSAGSFSKLNALSYKNKFNRAYSFLTEPENTVDIAGIGSSDLYSAFVPMQLYEKYGYTSTVISSPHQTCLKSYSFLEELLKCQHPKVLIIETDMFYEGAPEFNSKKIKKDNTSVIKRKISAFLENFSEKRFEDMIETQFSIFTFHDKWKQTKFFSSDDSKKDTKASVSCDHGYNFNDSIKPAQANDNMNPTDISEPIPEDNLNYLNKMVDLCREKGIDVVLVEMPTQHSWNYYRHNTVQAFADENKLRFIDFNLMFEELQLDIKLDYRDGGDHLNYYGATKTTAYLSDFLNETYSDILTDKRNDENYSFWEESNKEFKQKYNVNQ